MTQFSPPSWHTPPVQCQAMTDVTRWSSSCQIQQGEKLPARDFWRDGIPLGEFHPTWEPGLMEVLTDRKVKLQDWLHCALLLLRRPTSFPLFQHLVIRKYDFPLSSERLSDLGLGTLSLPQSQTYRRRKESGLAELSGYGLLLQRPETPSLQMSGTGIRQGVHLRQLGRSSSRPFSFPFS